MQPLIEEAAKKAAVAWLSVPSGGSAYPVWCVWIDGVLYVVTGPGEQATPGLAEAVTGGATIRVTLRGEHGGRVVTWPASGDVLQPGTEAWDSLAPQLAGKRLNSVGGATQTVERWANECQVFRLRPAGDAEEAGETLPSGDHAAQVRDTPAARQVRRPFRLHKVKRR